MGRQFLFPFYEVFVQSQWGHNVLRSSLRTTTLIVRVLLQLGWNTYLLLILIVNFVWKADEGEAKSIVLIIFVLWQCFNRQWVRDGGLGRNSYSVSAEIASFSRWDFIWSNKHDTFWHFAVTEYFHVSFLSLITVSDFRLLKICKNLGLPLSTITFTVNSHADNHFYKYICFSYYIIWNQIF